MLQYRRYLERRPYVLVYTLTQKHSYISIMPNTKNCLDTLNLRQDLRTQKAYAIASPPPQAIKLDAMENPHLLPNWLQEKLAKKLAVVALNRYPAGHDRLHQAIRAYTQMDDSLGLLCGNGSDEIITLLTQILPDHATILAPVPAFVMYAQNAQFLHHHFVGVPLNDAFMLDMPAMHQAIQTHAPALVYLAYPNNPTGRCFDTDDIDALIQAYPRTLMVIDEAYAPFTGGQSFLPKLAQLVQTYPNVCVMRTLSKLGLAGARLGYVAGHADLIDYLNIIKPPYNINALTYELVCCILEHADVLTQQTHMMVKARDHLSAHLAAIGGKVYPSDANFLVWHHPLASDIDVFLKQHHIYIKNISGMHTMLANTLRISVGTDQENAQLLATLAMFFQNFSTSNI